MNLPPQSRKPSIRFILFAIREFFRENKIYFIITGIILSFVLIRHILSSSFYPTVGEKFGIPWISKEFVEIFFVIIALIIILSMIWRDRSRTGIENDRYRSLTDHMVDVVWVVDLNQMHMVYISPSDEPLRGYTREESLNQTLEDILTEESYKKIMPLFQPRMEAFFSGDPDAVSQTYEMEQRCKDGSTIFTQTLTSLYFNQKGHIEMMGVTRDITQKKEDEKEKERYEIMALNSQDIILFIRAEDGKILEANRMADQVYGYTHEELLQKTLFDLRANTETDLNPEIILETYWDGILYETTHVCKDGRTFPLEAHTKGLLYEGERILVSSIRDITERKGIEQVLLERETQFRSLFTSMTDGFIINEIVYDEEGIPSDIVFLDVNPAFEKLSGIPRESLIGKRIREVNPDKSHDWREWVQLFGDVAITQSPFHMESTYSGEDIYYDIYAFCSMPNQVAVIIQDITKRKQVEAQLRKLSAAVQHSSVSVVITDIHGSIEYVNPKFTLLTGYSLEEVLGENPRILKTSITPVTTHTDMWQAIIDGNTWQGEFCNRKKNGETYWESATISPILDENGQITHFVAVKEDITVKKHMEEELRSERDFAMLVMNSMGQGLTVTGPTGRYEYVNPAFARLIDRNPQDLIGLHPFDVMHIVTHKPQPEDSIKSEKDSTYTYEALINRSDGELTPVLITEVPRLVNNAYFGSTSVVTDLTEQKQVEEHLRVMGTVDKLTGAYNRTFFENELVQLEHHSRNFPISVIVADIDDLKLVNDTKGHLAGDQLIQMAAQVLKSVIRSTDFIARIGGDEFALILPQTGEREAKIILNRIRENIRENNTSQTEFNLSISMGVATSQARKLIETLNEADGYMYEDKRARKRARQT